MRSISGSDASCPANSCAETRIASSVSSCVGGILLVVMSGECGIRDGCYKGYSGDDVGCKDDNSGPAWYGKAVRRSRMQDVEGRTPGRPTIAEVSLPALRENCRQAAALVPPGVAVLAVVKADGYGHGAVAAARAFLDGGAAGLGVSMAAEGRELRRAGIDAPIVVLGGAFPGEEAAVVADDLAAAVWTLEGGPALPAPPPPPPPPPALPLHPPTPT